MLGCWIRFGKSMEDKVKVLREDGGEGGQISACATGKDGRRERGSKGKGGSEILIPGYMCSAKAHIPTPLCLG